METPGDHPQQKNGYDCGVFACTCADFLSAGMHTNFTQRDVTGMRRLIALRILKGYDAAKEPSSRSAPAKKIEVEMEGDSEEAEESSKDFTKRIRNRALEVFDALTYAKRNGGPANIGEVEQLKRQLQEELPQTMKIVTSLFFDCRDFDTIKEQTTNKEGKVTGLKGLVKVMEQDNNLENVITVKARMSRYLEHQRDIDRVDCHKLSDTSEENFKSLRLSKKEVTELDEEGRKNFETNRDKRKKFYKLMDARGWGKKGVKPQKPLPLKDNHLNFVTISKTTAKGIFPHEFNDGDQVVHEKFGVGRVKKVEGKKVTVKFDEVIATKKKKKGGKKKGDKTETTVEDVETVPMSTLDPYTTTPGMPVNSDSVSKGTGTGKGKSSSSYETMPWIPTNFQSNGREVRVIMKTPAATKNKKVTPSLPFREGTPGVSELSKKGYSSLGVFDREKCKEGVWKMKPQVEEYYTMRGKDEFWKDHDFETFELWHQARLAGWKDKREKRSKKRSNRVDREEKLGNGRGVAHVVMPSSSSSASSAETPTVQVDGYLTTHFRHKEQIVKDGELETDSSYSVTDFGQRNPVSFSTNGTDSGIHLLTHEWVDEESGINWSQKYDENYRTKNSAYKNYLDEASEEASRTSDPTKFEQYCKMTAKWDLERRKYREDPRKLAMMTRIREKRQKTTAALARLITMTKIEDIKKELAGKREEIVIDKEGATFVDTAFIGDGALNIRGRGYRGYAKKGITRACASSYLPGGKRVRVCVFNEAYTSSRCPSCKTTQKMKSQRGDSETTEVKDTRMEVCINCDKKWPHDVVSIVNMLYIASCDLTDEDRPSWL
jgi:hypothetical protein